LKFERHINRIEWQSVEAFADFFMAHFPPMVAAQGMLGERFGEIMRQRIVITAFSRRRGRRPSDRSIWGSNRSLDLSRFEQQTGDA
jgi:hypothetical protein